MNLKFILLCLALLFSLSAFSQRDTLLLENGDRMVGEIKRMDRGILVIKTPYSSGDLKVKWKKIETIKSVQSFLVSAIDGKRYKIDGLNTNNSDRLLVLKEAKEPFGMNDIVFLRRVKDGFISRLNASISFGYNFTKASNLSQLSVASTLGYTSDYYSIGTTFNSVRSSQDKVDEIQRTNAELSFNYFLKRDDYLIYQSEFLSNSEQKLKLRMTNKLGYGKYFVHSNRMFLAGVVGAAWNNEKYERGINENRNSGEVYGTLEVNLFDFNDISLISSITAYPSLTEKDRVRTDFKLDLKYDLPLDLFVKLGFNYNYDNQPVEGASYSDYVIRTTLGWEL